MTPLLILMLACGGDTDGPSDTDTDVATDTDSFNPFDVILDSAATTPTADTGSTTDSPTDETPSTTEDTASSLLVGRTFRFNPQASSLPGIYAYFGPSDTVFLLEVIGASSSTLDVRIGSFSSAGGGSQNVCVPTTDALGVDFSADPDLTIGPLDGTIVVNGYRHRVEDATSQMRFNATYDAITNASFDGLINISSLSSASYGSPTYLCSVLGAYYSGCAPCPSTGANECLPVNTTGGEAREFPGLNLVARTEADILADPACP